LVAKLAALTPKPDLAVTTNGATLGLVASDLKAAGLDRVNISLDSLRRERFAAITKRDALGSVLDGIASAKEAGFAPIKVNCVLVRGVNDDEIVDFATFGRQQGVSIRFIEFMPLDAQDQWSAARVVPSREVIERIHAVYPLEPVAQGPEPAARYRFADGGSGDSSSDLSSDSSGGSSSGGSSSGGSSSSSEIGVIASVTEPFCGDCDRVRLTADGQFFTCLFGLEGYDVRSVLREGGSDDDVAALLQAAVGAKWAGHGIGTAQFVRPPRSMSQIGG
jgi:cyclic pyranopterin phosphate synthase